MITVHCFIEQDRKDWGTVLLNNIGRIEKEIIVVGIDIRDGDAFESR